VKWEDEKTVLSKIKDLPKGKARLTEWARWEVAMSGSLILLVAVTSEFSVWERKIGSFGIKDWLDENDAFMFDHPFKSEHTTVIGWWCFMQGKYANKEAIRDMMQACYKVDAPVRLFEDVVKRRFGDKELETRAMKIEVERGQAREIKKALYENCRAMDKTYHPYQHAVFVPMWGDHMIPDSKVGQKFNEQNEFLNNLSTTAVENISYDDKPFHCMGATGTL
jgi:hypothetical protein